MEWGVNKFRQDKINDEFVQRNVFRFSILHSIMDTNNKRYCLAVVTVKAQLVELFSSTPSNPSQPDERPCYLKYPWNDPS